jgi:hypothetical protein
MEAPMTGSDPPPGGDPSTGDEPWLGVHVLSEFTFCARAGYIALGTEAVDRGDDYWLRPNLDYRPSYALYELRREILVASVQTLLLGIASGAVLVGCFLLLRAWSVLPLAAGVALFVALAWPLSRSLARLLSLLAAWKRIRSLAPREPDPDATTPQPVIWWELLRAGFDPVRLPEPLDSPASRIAGRPWRILRKGDLQIPVFRVPGESPEQLYPKHAVRAAAYCALVERTVGARSPYAIALFAGTYNGWTFPNTPEARAFLDQVVSAARAYLEPDVTIGPPASTGICAGCPHGSPRVYRRSESETVLSGTLVRPHGRTGQDGRVYHSTCGDQFGWTPPHDAATALGITARSEDASPGGVP